MSPKSANIADFGDVQNVKLKNGEVPVVVRVSKYEKRKVRTAIRFSITGF